MVLAQQMEASGESLLNISWWVLKSLKISEMTNVKTFKSLLGLLNKWESCIKITLHGFHLSLDCDLNNGTFGSFILSNSILSLYLDFLNSYDLSLSIGTFLLCLYLNRENLELFLKF